ncbi:hypothetical protein SAMN02745180_01192 [Sporanaerobacter acetigenes DSM 13106]|uniref:Uncharacterized protein n=1 Tax=Sporanaerobacter acetigenes DSM 13106 TaxID=1123281 RepID=A0A1M5WE25_9FIRM|nr:hypothetical protein SAMN02745180_01192 [Sporanaerobacter acetigenes DSM 13106]
MAKDYKLGKLDRKNSYLTFLLSKTSQKTIKFFYSLKLFETIRRA